MGFNAISKIWLLALLVPLIIFYFLKLKRQRVKVPSLFLWEQVLKDQRVNSPFQRFKRHILLLLQLLLLSLLIFAALEPYCYGSSSSNIRIPILVDTSASMGAKDASGRTRLEIAKEKIQKIISNKVSNQQFAILSFNSHAQKITGFTDNSIVLLDALKKLSVEDLPSNIEDALRMTQAIAKNHPFDKALLFSDGNFPYKTDFNLSFQLDFQKITTIDQNIGITSFTAQNTTKGSWQIFVEVCGFGNPKPATIELLLNGKTIGTESFAPTTNEPEKITFTTSGNNIGELKIHIKPSGFDALKSDNSAWLHLPRIRPLQIYISSDLDSLQSAMGGIDNIIINSQKNNSNISKYDLIITDKSSDTKLDSSIVLTVGIVPKRLTSLLKIEDYSVEIIDWDHDAPLLRHVELAELSILEGVVPQKEKNIIMKDIASLGYETLIFAKKGPLLIKRNSERRIEYNLFFHPKKSTFPYRIAYPIFIKNLIEISKNKAGLSDLASYHTGTLPDTILKPDTDYKINYNGNYYANCKSDKNGLIQGILAKKSGVYNITHNGKSIKEIGVSLLNKKESSLLGISNIKFNELTVKANNEQIKNPKSLWKLFAILALIMLFLEWVYFNKR